MPKVESPKDHRKLEDCFYIKTDIFPTQYLTLCCVTEPVQSGHGLCTLPG